MVEVIEKQLSELMNLISEEEYASFIENDKLLKIYDLVMNLDDNSNVLTDETLEKISKLVEAKLNTSR